MSATHHAISANLPTDPSPGSEQRVEELVRIRLRSLRHTLGLSLDELAARTHIGASTISRIETGKRGIGLDVLVPLARALQVDLDALLAVDDDRDVVIRPTPDVVHGYTTWMLSRPTGNTRAMKMRFEPSDTPPVLQVHPGHDWFFVLEGRIRLHLAERQLVVETGEAAEFATMTPHAIAAIDEPAEVIMIFDHDGQRVHTRHDVDNSSRALSGEGNSK